LRDDVISEISGGRTSAGLSWTTRLIFFPFLSGEGGRKECPCCPAGRRQTDGLQDLLQCPWPTRPARPCRPDSDGRTSNFADFLLLVPPNPTHPYLPPYTHFAGPPRASTSASHWRPIPSLLWASGRSRFFCSHSLDPPLPKGREGGGALAAQAAAESPFEIGPLKSQTLSLRQAFSFTPSAALLP
jgi:hypothetical protein